MQYTKLGNTDIRISRICIDYVVLYIYHMWDWNTPICGATRLHHVVAPVATTDLCLATEEIGSQAKEILQPVSAG